jgi:hypothetical protein
VRYFFHVRSELELVRDVEGAEYATSDEARLEAIAIARELIGRQLLRGAAVDWTTVVQIEREDGATAVLVGFVEAAGLRA